MIKFSNINRFIICAFAALFVVGCAESDFEGTTYPTTAYTEGGGILVISDIVTGFYDILNPTEASIGFTLNPSPTGETVSGATIYKSYKGGDPIAHTTVNELPAALTIPLTEAADGLVDVGDIELGDVFTFSFDVTTPSGVYASGKRVSIPLSCASAIVEGTYVGSTTGSSTDGCCPGSVSVDDFEVTITSVGSGNYTVSDFTSGLYLAWYGPDGGDYGITSMTNLSAEFNDFCNELTGSFGEPFGETVTLTGNYDQPTGVITYNWISGWGDEGSVTLTPK